MDRLTNEQRHKNMSRIKNKDTLIELTLRKALWNKGIRYRKNYIKLPGKPDIAITKYKIAVFCDSEFFHGKDWNELKIQLERSKNSDFWIRKISNNIERDNLINKQLVSMGWTVIRFWGKDIMKNANECIKAIEEAIFDRIITIDDEEEI
jgi:DNA mismatch endonuclease (patch repair protein)